MSIVGFVLPISDLTASLQSLRTGDSWNRDQGTTCSRKRQGSWGRPLLHGGLNGRPISMEPQDVSRHLKAGYSPSGSQQNHQLTSAMVLFWSVPSTPGDTG